MDKDKNNRTQKEAYSKPESKRFLACPQGSFSIDPTDFLPSSSPLPPLVAAGTEVNHEHKEDGKDGGL